MNLAFCCQTKMKSWALLGILSAVHATAETCPDVKPLDGLDVEEYTRATW
jgi:hypothetical protein